MTFTVNSKSQLAKLMATENITVEHQSISTAKFDVKNRILYCPVWKEMSGELYDLLMGHEVGHAIDTPAEGWHDAILEEKEQVNKLGKYYGPGFKNFLNVVEDARIEKRMKRRYPGLRRSFVAGYKTLIERDFFGVKYKNLDLLPFIDRLNLFTKGGYLFPVEFSEQEMPMVRAVENCETWDDVVSVAKIIWEYSKQEQKQLKKQQEPDFGDDSDDGDSIDDFDSDNPDDSDEFSDSDDYGPSDSDDYEYDESDEEYYKDFIDNDDKEDKKPTDYNIQDKFEPSCRTDEEFRKKEFDLISTKHLPYVYLTFPKPILENIITPYRVVHEKINKYVFQPSLVEKVNAEVQSFKTKNERYVSLLAKEFEMRKAAKSFAKNRVANTGDLDISKIFKYQVEENLFKKKVVVAKGKSHGMILLFDRSGSMRNNMAGTIEQILVLTSFCRKVNIPFVVYGFGDSYNNRSIDNDVLIEDVKNTFSLKKGDLGLNAVFLREYMSSNMSSSEYNNAFRNMLFIKSMFESSDNYGPMSESYLSNTPLLEAMVACKELTTKFRKKYNLDIVNLILLHDGEADSRHAFMAADNEFDRINYYEKNFIFRDNSCNFESELFDRSKDCLKSFQQKEVFEWYKKSTGAKIYGFFISGDGARSKSMIRNYLAVDRDQTQEFWNKMKKDRFLESTKKGYNKFFLIFGDRELSINSTDFEIEENASNNKIKTAFMKHLKKRKVNRVLVNRFISEISV